MSPLQCKKKEKKKGQCACLFTTLTFFESAVNKAKKYRIHSQNTLPHSLPGKHIHTSDASSIIHSLLLFLRDNKRPTDNRRRSYLAEQNILPPGFQKSTKRPTPRPLFFSFFFASFLARILRSKGGGFGIYGVRSSPPSLRLIL
jgi:hypothetical protein